MNRTMITRLLAWAVALMLCMSAVSFASADNGNGYPDYLNLDSLLPIVKWDHEPITLKILVKRDATVDIEDVWFWQWAEKNMNLKFEIEEVTSASLTERKATMFASQDLPDIMFNLGLKPAEYTTYGQNEGELLALNEYINETLMPNANADREEMPIAFIACTCANGKMYGLPRLAVQWQGAGDTIGDLRMFINAKWLEACELDPPETLDDFVEMLRTFKEVDPMNVGENIIPVIDNGGKLRSYIWNALGFIDGDGYGTAPAIKNARHGLYGY